MTPKQTAETILKVATDLGWTVSVGNDILTIKKKFTPGNNDEFVQADGEYYSILSLLRQTRPGSVWGTDGGGVGAIAALRSGLMQMHKSGGEKRVLTALSKLL